jgi:transcription-repair coupling factor (superfamily II helicase)
MTTSSNQGAAQVLDRLRDAAPVRERLRSIAAGEPVVFEHVTEPAQAFLAAIVAGASRERCWIVCENARAQETVFNELLNWHPETAFFPEKEIALGENVLPDPEIAAERLALLQTLSAPTVHKSPKSHPSQKSHLLVLTKASLSEQVPSPAGLRADAVQIKRGARLDRDAMVARLSSAGYEPASQVAMRGQFAIRGGILDIFGWNHTQPVRIELFGDEIESIRQFDLDAQTSVEHLDSCTILLAESDRVTCPLSDYIRKSDVTINVNAGFTEARVHILAAAQTTDGPEDYSAAFFDHGLGEFEVGDFVVDEGRRAQFFRQLQEWRGQGWCTYIFCNNEGEIERLRELIPEEEHEQILFAIGGIARGFAFPAGKLAVLSDAELFGRYRNTRARRMAMRRMREQASRSHIDFSELNEGDYVVHLEHGIGKFLGLRKFATDGKEEEVLTLEFDDDSRLYVPLEQSFLVSRYVGVGKKAPALSSLGDARWAKAKKNAEQAIYSYAAQLLTIHAQRETSVGYAFPPDSKWVSEFEASFIYKETVDQLTAIAATKADMESERPMDRLICGDVGFGKTEVAIRAAFKAVMGGKQVAVLAPTTVLAQQHYQTFRERMSDYPVKVEMLSRFRTKQEQNKTVKELREGGVDIVVGTHRLISGDIEFKDLGLVVIDEEQRFGVRHKERFKEIFKLVDVLTLSATPIPRTLYLSLMGAKDMSILETAPANRIPTETIICGYDERVIRDAIQRELARQGQVYFLHNRVQTIERVALRIKELCPGVKVAIGHGQMDEDDLEEVMQRFVAGKTDVLVSTTIIESGLDIPNANTIIIDRADRFGLADLYQLRGRVGRAQMKAYAYLMLPREMMTVGAARKRINAIKQYSTLGAGFKIAMRDLEIRGAGNVLGTAQSGHIVAIGFDLYCQLLKQAVTKLKGEKTKPRVEVPVRFDFLITNEAEFAQAADPETTGAFLPAAYITEPKTRIQAYRALAEVATQEQLDKVRKNWRDRFGPLPESVENLVILSEIKLASTARKITKVEVKEGKLMLTRGGDFMLVSGKFPRLQSRSPAEALRETLALIRNL